MTIHNYKLIETLFITDKERKIIINANNMQLLWDCNKLVIKYKKIVEFRKHFNLLIEKYDLI